MYSPQLLFSSGKRVSPPSGWSQAETPALWGCRGLFGRMWTQRPVSYRKGWPETYWILGAEPRPLGQSGRLKLSHVGLELRHLQEPKREVLSTEDSSHPWAVRVERGWVGREHLPCCYQPWLFYGCPWGRSWEVFFFNCGKMYITHNLPLYHFKPAVQ